VSTRDSEDRLEDRLDEDERGLAEVLAPSGFELRRPRKRPWQELELTSFPEPQLVVARATGELRGALVDLYEYEVAVKDSSPKPMVAVVLRHPAIAGQARVSKREGVPWYGWVMMSPLLVLVLPILLPIAFFEWLGERNPHAWKERSLGAEPFDRAYKVQARSAEEATAALPAALQNFLLSEVNGARAEVRSGVLACTLPLTRFDRGTAARVMELAERLLAAAVPDAGTTADAPYRVSVPVAASAEDDESTVSSSVEGRGGTRQ
jgi:hypothetical protein